MTGTGEIVETQQGRLRGARHALGPISFQGAPFAAPPVGPLRFRPPAPPAAWEDVRDALEPGPVSPQERMPGSTSAMGEDCLYLNVMTPALDDTRRPVLIYIHAGAFIQGSGSTPVYDGVHLAADQDLVVVSINYRLGVLGFPPFKVFGEGTPQNLGLLDQIAALEWVRDNIAGFGGDPDCVTVCGYSAGGWSIAALLAMPEARGLFHRAAPQSGGFMFAMSPKGQAMHTQAFMGALGLDPGDLDALMETSVDDLLAAQAKTIALWQGAVAENQVIELDFPFTPLRDGVTLHDDPIASLQRGACADLPVLVGTTADELGAAPFRMALPWLVPSYTQASLEQAIGVISTPDLARAMWRGYAAAHPDTPEPTVAGYVRSDWMYRMPAIRVAEARAGSGPGSWMYRFEIGGESAEIGGVSTHATDVTFWFGSMALSPYQQFFFGREPNAEEKALSRRMQADLAAFCRTGTCAWPRYGLEDRATMTYGHEVQVTHDPAGVERALWASIL